MKAQLLAITCLVSLLVIHSAESAESNQAQSNLATRMETRIGSVSGGSNIGGSPRSSTYDAIQWCNGTVGVLQNHLEQANIPVIHGRMMDSVVILEKGIFDALNRTGAQNATHSLMYIALQRGITLIETLRAFMNSPVGSYITAETAISVLGKYYRFLINTVSVTDVDFYIPYVYSTNGAHGQQDQDKFENRYVEYAKAAMSWINTAFVVHAPEAYIPGQPMVGAVPAHSSKLYMTMAQMVTGFVVADLSGPEFIWHAKYACVVEDLRVLNQMIAQHNAGNTTVFANDARFAVNLIYKRINELSYRIDRLSKNGACRDISINK